MIVHGYFLLIVEISSNNSRPRRLKVSNTGDFSASTEDILEDDACMQDTNIIEIEVTGQDIQNSEHGFKVQDPRSMISINTHLAVELAVLLSMT